VSSRQYALKFISGKYQGGEFPLKMGREVVIGRSSDLDMVLVEDMVSRRHAKIDTRGNDIIIQDLGSTNGTFVNGEKIKRARLKEGDRILIGTSIIKLIALSEGESISRPSMPRPPGTGSFRSTMTTGNRSMEGTIDEIPLPDLLQLLSSSRKSGVLEIRGPEGVGRIYLRKGQIYYATIDDSFDLSPRKCLYRILVWKTGTFSLQPPDDRSFLEEIDEPTEGLLIEAMRQLDTIRHMAGDLPDRSAFLELCRPIRSPLRDLSPVQLDVLQHVHNSGLVALVLDRCPQPDLECYEALLHLLGKGYVRERELPEEEPDTEKDLSGGETVRKG